MLAAGAAVNLDAILARWRPVRMPFDAAGLTPRQRQTVEKLVEASRLLDDIFWRQSDPEALELYKTTRDPKLRRLLMINGSRFDLLNENRPFVGTEPMPPGHALYPKGLTREQVEAYLKRHPEDRKALYDPYTVVRWKNGRLTATPYRIEYRAFLEPAARALREAAGLSDDAAFANFLRLRAAALLNDDYYASDLAWLDLRNPKIDVIFAPYETYLDDLLGVKTSYGAAVLIRNEAESARLAAFEKYIPDIQDALPLAAPDRPSKRGHLSPMEVADSPYRAGDLRHGYQAVADNLPNDPRIHAQKGSKKIFFKNFMDARVEYIILPIARRLMRADQVPHATGEGYFLGTLLHEISHGLGPAFARIGRQAGGYPGSHRRALLRAGGGQGGRGGHVRPGVAGEPRRVAEGEAHRGIRVVPGGHAALAALRHRRSPRPRRDDGVQLLPGAGGRGAGGRRAVRGGHGAHSRRAGRTGERVARNRGHGRPRARRSVVPAI